MIFVIYKKVISQANQLDRLR